MGDFRGLYVKQLAGVATVGTPEEYNPSSAFFKSYTSTADTKTV